MLLYVSQFLAKAFGVDASSASTIHDPIFESFLVSLSDSLGISFDPKIVTVGMIRQVQDLLKDLDPGIPLDQVVRESPIGQQLIACFPRTIEPPTPDPEYGTALVDLKNAFTAEFNDKWLNVDRLATPLWCTLANRVASVYL